MNTLKYQRPKKYLLLIACRFSFILMSLCWSIFIVIDSYWILFGVRMEKEHQYVDYDMNIIKKQHRFTKLFSSVYRPSLYTLLELQSKYVIDVCKKFNIECWLDGGTLLGSYREKRIFAWDEDGDFNVHKKDIEKFKQLVKTGQFRKFAKEYINPENYNRKDYYGFDIILRHDVNDIFARCVDYNTKTYIDFFRFETINEYEYVTGDEKISVNESSYNKYDKRMKMKMQKKAYIYKGFAYSYMHCKHCIQRKSDARRAMKVPFEWVFPLVDCKLNGMTTKCPKNTQAWLRYQYGDSYSLPPFYQRKHIKIGMYCLSYYLIYLCWKIFKILIQQIQMVYCGKKTSNKNIYKKRSNNCVNLFV